MNLTRRAVILAAASTASINLAAIAEDRVQASDEAEYVQLFPIYCCATSQYDELSPLMKTLSESFDGKSIISMEKNPRCCVWFEIVTAANPGTDGWYVWHDAGGTIIVATNLIQLKIAVDSLIRVGKLEDGHRVLRTGITTSFPVNRLL